MSGGVVYHWKHGWIPLDHAAALSHAKGNPDAAKAMLSGIPREHLRRESHIMAARAPRGRVALLDKKTGHSTGINESHAASFHSQGHTITSVNADGTFTTFTTRQDGGKVGRYGPDGRLIEPSPTAQRATELRANADAKMAEANRIADTVGFGDRAAGRLSGPGLNQFNRNVDSALQRTVAAQNAAQAAHFAANVAQSRADEAAREKFTHADLSGITHVNDGSGWHEVVRVNGKTVTVKTPYSWTDTIPHGKIKAVAVPGSTPGKSHVFKSPSAKRGHAA